MGAEFPQAPPQGFFLTKIFHPNVSAKGDICVDTLKKDWKPERGIKHVLISIRCLLIVPNPESALNEEAGRLLLEAYEDYAKHARLMTSIHARPKQPSAATVTAPATATTAASATVTPSALVAPVDENAASGANHGAENAGNAPAAIHINGVPNVNTNASADSALASKKQKSLPKEAGASSSSTGTASSAPVDVKKKALKRL
jgi:ubiquitin-conjugating enzyme E2 S